METSLHRQLKSLYAGPQTQLEVRVAKYRIDAVVDGRLVEIQHGPLGAIRDKVRQLLAEHRVLVVKPIVVRKTLVKLAGKGGTVVQRRISPKQGKLLDLFDDLVHFTRVFPHPRLELQVPMVEVEEWRYPGHGRRRRWRTSDHVVEDQKLLAVRQTHRLQVAADLVRLLGCRLEGPFDTGSIARTLEVRPWIAQRIAYCLCRMGASRQIGKRGNLRVYEWEKAIRRCA